MNLLLMTLIGALAFLAGVALYYMLALRSSLKSCRAEIAALRLLASESGGRANAVSEPLIRMLVGEPTITTRCLVVFPPRMSLTSTRTRYSPAWANVRVTVELFGPNWASLKSQ